MGSCVIKRCRRSTRSELPICVGREIRDPPISCPEQRAQNDESHRRPRGTERRDCVPDIAPEVNARGRTAPDDALVDRRRRPGDHRCSSSGEHQHAGSHQDAIVITAGDRQRC